MRHIVARGMWGLACLGIATTLIAQEPFSKTVGQVTVAPVKQTTPLELPYITWGGDVATFYANGGLTTKPGTLFAQQGLNLKLTPGDDFVGQVRNYLSGKTPFLRGTTAMIGLASEVIGADPRTKPVVFLQLTWSRGDHMVGRDHVKDLNGLKGKRIALQKGGPHVGLLDEILSVAQLTWNDIDPVFVEDLTGDKGAAALFRKDKTIDACMVISPDMAGLTGGLAETGTGAEGTVKGARVVISTANMNRSIADVYACRKDFFDANKPLVEKLTAAYLKASEEVVDLKRAYVEKKNSPKYVELLKLTQSIYGKEVIPTWEVDADGLVADCEFVGHPGNVLFFTVAGNRVGFKEKESAALKLATGQGYAKVRAAFIAPAFDYDALAKLGKLTRTELDLSRFTAEDSPDTFTDPDKLTGDAIYTFDIHFEPREDEFKAEIYGPQFQQVIDQSAKFSNSVIVVVGHADPTKTLKDLVEAGMSKGIITRVNERGVVKFYINGKPLDLSATETVVDLINKGAFAGAKPDPRVTVQAALNLSKRRAEAVRDAIVKFAKDKQYLLDASQIAPTGMGISQPVISKPKSIEEAMQNMRVQFKLMPVSAEVSKPSDFDF